MVIGRAVEEWVGKTPDTPVPPRVRLRVFLAHGGRCYLSGRPIRPGEKWELEHVKGLAVGGENREANLAPALVAPHRAKTTRERMAQPKSDSIAKKHLGIDRPKGRIRSRGFDKTKTRRFDGTVAPR